MTETSEEPIPGNSLINVWKKKKGDIPVQGGKPIILSTFTETGNEEYCLPVLNKWSDIEGDHSAPFDSNNNPSADHDEDLKENRLPIVTLSSLTEVGIEESSILVPKQRSYTGRKPAIPQALADTRCSYLGVNGLLQTLNTVLDTSYSLNSGYEHCNNPFQLTTIHPCHHRKLVELSVLEDYITRDVDFGTAYAYLRPYWHDVTTTKERLRVHQEEDHERRRNVLIDNVIRGGETPPRRVWDLYANRVVPFWVACEYPWGISHAWLDEKDRSDVWTPINDYEWPVPIPKNGKLDLIRIEMLNLGAEYVWLDVLCLRQPGGRRDDLRVEEWKVDVPTIGAVYRDVPVAGYFSGLGHPLRLQLSDFRSDRCWFRRAWTLQEIPEDMIIVGETCDDGTMEEEVCGQFQEKLASLQEMRRSDCVFDVLSQMQGRTSVNPVDKVAGVAYLLYSEYIPIYDGAQSEEDAWTVLVNVMQHWSQMHFLFLYPKPGNGHKRWRPSWKQAMTERLPSNNGARRSGRSAGGLRKTCDVDLYYGPCIDSCSVRGLADASSRGECREGELIVKDNTGELHTLKIVALHSFPIPDGSYMLLGSCRRQDPFWVVGRKGPDGFHKSSIFSLADIGERGKLRVAEHYVETVLC